ncbi:MAG: L-threonylcarbamoyladenylate synthase [Candidatus Shapirobacteria bacterium]|nr:L-threonylcarbamoyladenylate synthase [Candidatus Shapirobacteria bacterium]
MATIKQAAETIKNGGLVIFPTDTVYILAVDPTNQKAVDKLIAFKDRWPGKAISVAVDGVKMADKYVRLNERIVDLMANLLPGPFTLVIDGKHKMAKGVEAENGTLGIRIPDNQTVMELVETVGGPVTATSANLSGRTPHYSVESLMKTLSQKKKNMIDLVVDAGILPKNKPSTVIDLTMPEIKILRRGDLIIGNSKTLISKSERETEKIGEYLLKKTLTPTLSLYRARAIVIGLSGDLGCGKTVFSRAIGKYLGVEGKITSPTFVIMNEYKTLPPSPSLDRAGVKKFLHFDLYRITTEQELEEIGFLNQFKENTISCIEWPEMMGKENLEKLKKKVNYIPVNFRYVDEITREIEF